MTTTQKFKVVMVPTDKSKLALVGGSLTYLEVINADPFEKTEFCKPQNIYVVAKTEIKEVYPQIVIEKFNDGTLNLWQVDNINDIDKDNQFNIIASTDNRIDKPFIPNSYINDYVKAYNEERPLKEIEILFECVEGSTFNGDHNKPLSWDKEPLEIKT